MPKEELFNAAIVEKRNILNELRSNNMTLQELRFFSIYLSKINPWDKSTRTVRFPLEDFRRIMGLGYDMNIAHFRCTVRHILQQVVEVPNEKDAGYAAFQLFKKAKLAKNEQDEWYVEFDAHDDALPLMFDFKDRYFKYELWNALRLKSPNQVRMYEILKQYEKLGKRELTVTDLRELLGINKNEYSGRTGWSDFKKKVLDSCQLALRETTDICYTYERGKVGTGGRWLTIIFHIKKNNDYVDQLTLEQFISQQPEPDVIYADSTDITLEEAEDIYGSSRLANLAEACNYEFGKEEMIQLDCIIRRIEDIKPDKNTNSLEWGRVLYLQEQYAALNAADEQKRRNSDKIKNRFAYLKGMLEKKAEESTNGENN